MAMGRRIKERLDELGWSQVDLLSRVPGLSAGSLSALILRDSSRSQWSEQIAEALGVSHRYLQTGDGPKEAKTARELAAWKPTSKVPVLTWDNLAQAMKNNKALPPIDEAEPWVGAMHSKPSPRAFALVIESDSMTAASGPHSFPRGTVIIVDPERRPAPGDFVVAEDPVSGAATFKLLAADAGRYYLTALNPSYPSTPIPSLEAVIGVCCEWTNGGAL